MWHYYVEIISFKVAACYLNFVGKPWLGKPWLDGAKAYGVIFDT